MRAAGMRRAGSTLGRRIDRPVDQWIRLIVCGSGAVWVSFDTFRLTLDEHGVILSRLKEPSPRLMVRLRRLEHRSRWPLETQRKQCC